MSNTKDIIEEAVDKIDATFSFNEETGFFEIDIDGEKIFAYQDIFEDESTNQKKDLLVCELVVTDKINDLDFRAISESNEELFFSRVYCSEDKIRIESCLFLENTSADTLAIIIDEIASHSDYLKEEVL